MRDLELTWHEEWDVVWQRDDPYTVERDGGKVYLDKQTGRPRWLPTEEGVISDAELVDSATEIVSNLERFILVPPLRHGDHHEIFAEWIQGLPEEVRGTCNTKSIGGFKEDLEHHFPDRADELWWGWRDFHDEALRERARAWLAGEGIRVTWTV